LAKRARNGCVAILSRYRRTVVHLSVAIGRFFQALFYAILKIAGWAALEVIVGAGALVGAFLLARRLLKHDRRRP
jgi:hypothetical protein